MKILYAANVFGDEQMLKIFSEYANEAKPDATIIAGNIIKDVLSDDNMRNYVAGKIFNNNLNMFRGLYGKLDVGSSPEYKMLLNDLQKKLPSPCTQEAFEKTMINDVSKDLAFAKKFNPLYEVAKQIVEGYNQNFDKVDLDALVKEAANNMIKQHKKFAEQLNNLPAPVYTLPGNFDNYKIFEQIIPEANNLHIKEHDVSNLTLCGYGCAPGNYKPKMIVPLDLLLDEKDEAKELAGEELYISELEAMYHFIKTNPDVLVTYMPPKVDNNVFGVGEIGFESLTNCINRLEPTVVLTGLVYHALGATPLKPNNPYNKTTVIYPGSLGEAYGALGGEFCSLEFDNDEKLEKAVFYRITDRTQGKPSIKPVVAYDKTQNGLREKLFVQGQLDFMEKKQRLSKKNSP